MSDTPVENSTFAERAAARTGAKQIKAADVSDKAVSVEVVEDDDSSASKARPSTKQRSTKA